MKETMMYLSSIKSRYFMLLVYLFLIAGATSCRDDHFESDLADDSIQLSKAELIQQALSRLPQTRGVSTLPVRMVTIKDTVTIRCFIIGSMKIDWGDDSTVLATGYKTYTHIYSDDLPSHGICIEGSHQAIKHLHVQDNELIYLDVTNNINLQYFDCMRNYLDELDLTDCPNLRTLHAANNELSFIDITHLSLLETLEIGYNRLTHIDVSKNFHLRTLQVGSNKITDIDLRENINLSHIVLSGLSLRTINNRIISDTSFSLFSNLMFLDISHTPFTSLDLSDNPLVFGIDISGSDVMRLDISKIKINWLNAAGSRLTDWIYTRVSLENLYNLRIENTPYEKFETNTSYLISTLPDRNEPHENGLTQQGHLYTYSHAIMNPTNLSALTLKNWVVNE